MRVFEAGSGIGGTWYWNRYPGARCDAPSMEYSYQFDEQLQQDWDWSEKYATQPEILSYINHVADRFDLRSDIQLNTRVISATFAAAARWLIETDDGGHVSAHFCIMATGVLSTPIMPDIKGLDTFSRPDSLHGSVAARGRRLQGSARRDRPAPDPPRCSRSRSSPGMQRISTSSSAPPTIRYRRTTRRFRRMSAEQIKADYPGFREQAKQMFFGMNLPISEASALEATPEERERQYEDRWAQGGFTFLGAFGDLLLDQKANDTAAEFVRNKIRETVHDPAVAEKLMPYSVLGCKRLCIDTDYYETYNRSNVTLVDISETAIDAITSEVHKCRR